MYNGNFVILDIETGGFSCEKNPIIELALMVMDYEGKELSDFRYQTYVKNYDNLYCHPDALKVNQIKLEDVEKSGIQSKELVERLIEIFKDTRIKKLPGKPVLIGHNIVSFDSLFLVYLFKLHNQDLWKYVDVCMIDTLWLSRLKWGNDKTMINYQLITSCSKANVELIDSHRAMADVEATFKLFKYFMESLRSGKQTKEKEVRFRETFQF